MAMVRYEEKTPKKKEKVVSLDSDAYLDDYSKSYRQTALAVKEHLMSQVRHMQNMTNTGKTEGAVDGANEALENAADALDVFYRELLEMR